MHDEDWSPSRLVFSIHHNLHRQPRLGQSTTQQCLSLAQVIQVVITTNICAQNGLMTGGGGAFQEGERELDKNRERGSIEGILTVPLLKRQ
jgi:hypothetical protein